MLPAISIKPTLSVVVAVYNEREAVPILLDQLAAVLREVGRIYEIIVVDDGSSEELLCRRPGLAAIQASEPWADRCAVSLNRWSSSVQVVMQRW